MSSGCVSVDELNVALALADFEFESDFGPAAEN
jgi:hypothetical protein